jgi:hypothetical protein
MVKLIEIILLICTMATEGLYTYTWRLPEDVTHARARYKLHTARGPEQALFTTYTTKTVQNMNLSGNQQNINSLLLWLWENIRRS